MNIVFVCQSGILEIQSILLAASIRKFSPKHDLIAAVCEDFGEIHHSTYSMLDTLGVKIEHISNDYTPKYPVGNKTIASCLITGMFLDSDIICMNEFEDVNGVNLISTGRYDVITNKEWRNIHKLFKVPFENSFIHARSPLVIYDKIEFANSWNENCHKLWNAIHSGFPIRRIRQADQISLTITAQQFKSKIDDWDTNKYLLSPSEVFNFDSGELKNHYCPPFLVLQKGWLYYKRQGTPKNVSNNPNSLAYYDKIRSVIYSTLAEFPFIDRHWLWPTLHDLYFSHNPMPRDRMRNIICGVEGNTK